MKKQSNAGTIQGLAGNPKQNELRNRQLHLRAQLWRELLENSSLLTTQLRGTHRARQALPRLFAGEALRAEGLARERNGDRQLPTRRLDVAHAWLAEQAACCIKMQLGDGQPRRRPAR
eukprot:2575703-Pleurochrysis_carterae.AAC.6